jgi:hypothetical protein
MLLVLVQGVAMSTQQLLTTFYSPLAFCTSPR